MFKNDIVVLKNYNNIFKSLIKKKNDMGCTLKHFVVSEKTKVDLIYIL